MSISKYCSNCGKPIFAEDKFCGSCGAKINYSFSEENAESVGNNPPRIEKESYSLPKKKISAESYMFLISVGLIIVGIVLQSGAIGSFAFCMVIFSALIMVWKNFLSYLYLLLVIILLGTGLFLNNLSRISRFTYDYLTIWITLFLILSHVVLLVGMFCKKPWAQHLHFIIFIEFIFFTAWLFNNYNSQLFILIPTVFFTMLSVNTWFFLFRSKYL